MILTAGHSHFMLGLFYVRWENMGNICVSNTLHTVEIITQHGKTHQEEAIE